MTRAPITVTNEESAKLLAALQHKYGTDGQRERGIRNHCMAVLMLDAGLRVGEVVALHKSTLHYLGTPLEQLRVWPTIAKNKKERIIPLTTQCRDAIEAMETHIWSQFPKFLDPLAFYQLDPSIPITTRQVERIIRDAAMNSLGRPVHPHVLRHTFASRLMRTTNARIVQELLGHEHLTTTQIYTHPNQEDLKKAITTLERKNSAADPQG